MFVNNYYPGKIVTPRRYIENTGDLLIDDLIKIVITDSNGYPIYRKMKPIYIDIDDIETVQVEWNVPVDASKGLYMLRVEFDDMEINFLPSMRPFHVG